MIAESMDAAASATEPTNKNHRMFIRLGA